MRALSSAVLAELTADSVRPCFFLEIETASSTLRYWTGNADLSWNGSTWLSNGFLKDIGPMRETGELSAEGLEVKLVGEPSALVSLHLQSFRQNKNAKLWLGFLNEARAILVDPILLFWGKVDTSTLDDDVSEATIRLAFESILIDLERPRDLRYNHEGQQSIYPGDLFFEYVEQLQDANFFWGKKKKKNKKKNKKDRGGG